MNDKTETYIEEQAVKPRIINTTIGDLVFALVEAAKEASIDEQDLVEVTQIMLADLLNNNTT